MRLTAFRVMLGFSSPTRYLSSTNTRKESCISRAVGMLIPYGIRASLRLLLLRTLAVLVPVKQRRREISISRHKKNYSWNRTIFTRIGVDGDRGFEVLPTLLRCRLAELQDFDGQRLKSIAHRLSPGHLLLHLARDVLCSGDSCFPS